MGIAGVLKALKACFGHIVNIFDPTFPFKAFAIDLDSLCHETLSAAPLDPSNDAKLASTATFDVILSRKQKIEAMGGRCVFVLSGRSLPAKHDEDERRAVIRTDAKAKFAEFSARGEHAEATKFLRKSITLTSEYKRCLVALLRFHAIPFLIAPYEADGQLGYLFKEKLCDVVVARDSDMFAYGITRLVTEIDWRSGVATYIDTTTDVASKVHFKCQCLSDASSHEPDALEKTTGAFLRLVPKFGSCDVIKMLGACIGCDYGSGLAGIGIAKSIAAIDKCSELNVRNVVTQLESIRIMASKKRLFTEYDIKRLEDVVSVYTKHTVFRSLTLTFGPLDDTGGSVGPDIALEHLLGPEPPSTSSNSYVTYLKHVFGDVSCDNAEEWPECMPVISLSTLSNIVFDAQYSEKNVDGVNLPTDAASWNKDNMTRFLRLREVPVPTTLEEMQATCTSIMKLESSPGYGRPRIAALELLDSIESLFVKQNITPSTVDGLTSSCDTAAVCKMLGDVDAASWVSFQVPAERHLILNSVVEVEQSMVYHAIHMNAGVEATYRISRGYERAVSMTTAELGDCRIKFNQPQQGPLAGLQIVTATIASAMKSGSMYEVIVVLSSCSRPGTSPLCSAVLHANCTCVVGLSGGCQHVATLLWILHCMPRTFRGVPCIVSPTAQECQWNKPSKAAVQAVQDVVSPPMEQLVFKKRRPHTEGKPIHARKKLKLQDQSPKRKKKRKYKKKSISTFDSDAIIAARKVYYAAYMQR